MYEEMPKTMTMPKKEFDKTINFWLYNLKNKLEKISDEKERKEEELKEYTLMFGQLQELYSFFMKHEEIISVHIKDLMDEMKDYDVHLGKYGKVLEYDDEAKWFYFRDFEDKDVLKYTKEENEKFLNKRKENDKN